MSILFEPFASSSAGCAYRLSGGGAKAPLLIDCGLPFKKLQEKLGFQVSALAGCLVSHAHGDHCKAAPELMSRGVSCYASKDTWAAMPTKGPNYSGYRANVLECEDGEGKPIAHYVGDWRIQAFPVVHDCPGTLGFLIDSPDASRLLYLTDSMYSPWTFPGMTHIAVECNHSEELLRQNASSGEIDPSRFKRVLRNHMSIERLESMLVANDLSKVAGIWLLHLSDSNSNAEEFRTRIQRLTGKPVFVCET